MAVFALPNPKKELFVDFPIQQIIQSIKSIPILNSKYKPSSSNEAFNQYTFESNEFLSFGVFIDINLNSINERKTQIVIEVRRKIGTFDQSHEVTNANNYISQLTNLIAKGTNQHEVIAVINRENSLKQYGEKSWLTTLLLCLFVGVFGGHRFYTGKTKSGLLQLVTFGGVGLWVLIDLVMIISGNFKDSNGNPLYR